MKIGLGLTAIAQDLQPGRRGLQLAHEVQQHAVGRGRADHVGEAKDVGLVEEALAGGADLGFGGQLHGPVVGDRSQRSRILIEGAIAEVAVDGRGGGEIEGPETQRPHGLQHTRGGQEGVADVDPEIGGAGGDVGVRGQMPDLIDGGVRGPDGGEQFVRV